MNTPAQAPIIITRTFDAPRDLVWKAWTEKEHLLKWFSPAGMEMAHCDLDLRAGGRCLYALKPVGQPGPLMWGLWKFQEVAPPERLVLVQSFSDENGAITHHEMMPTWPAQIHSTATFEERDGKTLLTIRWLPVEGTVEEQRQTFEGGRVHVPIGWEGTFKQLDAYLAAGAR
jgi:uncharacterized protein YndB with AHSA1/START domain